MCWKMQWPNAYFIELLQRLPIAHDLLPSKESDKVCALVDVNQRKNVEIISILTTIQSTRTKKLPILSADRW